ncbi:hypothetical protein [Flavobacterium aquidurense]|uniref:hypothetical protein n=1 Tax=Flavobacterium aquidurense TaxID=362413 RepID=UPI0037231F2D
MTIDKIQQECQKYNISNYKINADMSIDVKGDVKITDENITKLPLKFNNVNGNFICCRNKLTTLVGSPVIIGGNANFSGNMLTSLKGCPKYIYGHITFNQNQLTSLEYCPDYIGKNFNCSDNEITSLDFFPKNLGGKFNCRRNPNDQEFVFREKSILDLMIKYDNIDILSKIQIYNLDYENLERQFILHKIINEETIPIKINIDILTKCFSLLLIKDWFKIKKKSFISVRSPSSFYLKYF